MASGLDRFTVGRHRSVRLRDTRHLTLRHYTYLSSALEEMFKNALRKHEHMHQPTIVWTPGCVDESLEYSRLFHSPRTIRLRKLSTSSTRWIQIMPPRWYGAFNYNCGDIPQSDDPARGSYIVHYVLRAVVKKRSGSFQSVRRNREWTTHAVRQDHCTPVDSLAISGDGTFGARCSFALITPAPLGIKRGKKQQVGGDLKADFLPPSWRYVVREISIHLLKYKLWRKKKTPINTRWRVGIGLNRKWQREDGPKSAWSDQYGGDTARQQVCVATSPAERRVIAAGALRQVRAGEESALPCPGMAWACPPTPVVFSTRPPATRSRALRDFRSPRCTPRFDTPLHPAEGKLRRVRMPAAQCPVIRVPVYNRRTRPSDVMALSQAAPYPNVLRLSVEDSDSSLFGQRICRPYSDRVNVTSLDAEFRTRPRTQERPIVDGLLRWIYNATTRSSRHEFDRSDAPAIVEIESTFIEAAFVGATLLLIGWRKMFVGVGAVFYSVAAVAEQLVRSPRLPPRRSGFDPRPGHSGFSHVGIVPDDAVGRRVFLGDFPFSPALSFRRCSSLTSLTFIGSRDLDVKSRPNLFTKQLHARRPAHVQIDFDLRSISLTVGKEKFEVTVNGLKYVFEARTLVTLVAIRSISLTVGKEKFEVTVNGLKYVFEARTLVTLVASKAPFRMSSRHLCSSQLKISAFSADEICPVCHIQVDHGNDVVLIRQKGADGINAASVQRSDTIAVIAGSKVHTEDSVQSVFNQVSTNDRHIFRGQDLHSLNIGVPLQACDQAPPVQPLYWKAVEIITDSPLDSHLRVPVPLGPSKTCSNGMRQTRGLYSEKVHCSRQYSLLLVVDFTECSTLLHLCPLYHLPPLDYTAMVNKIYESSSLAAADVGGIPEDDRSVVCPHFVIAVPPHAGFTMPRRGLPDSQDTTLQHDHFRLRNKFNVYDTPAVSFRQVLRGFRQSPTTTSNLLWNMKKSQGKLAIQIQYHFARLYILCVVPRTTRRRIEIISNPKLLVGRQNRFGFATIYLAFHWLLAVVSCASELCDSGRAAQKKKKKQRRQGSSFTSAYRQDYDFIFAKARVKKANATAGTGMSDFLNRDKSRRSTFPTYGECRRDLRRRLDPQTNCAAGATLRRVELSWVWEKKKKNRFRIAECRVRIPRRAKFLAWYFQTKSSGYIIWAALNGDVLRTDEGEA
ncbi:hypothetical protein PR048_004354 [Dryococelus australis]|uniref:Uncharacterized protein n=1 Tax=Dryococelus australis TaxID=614101 RepID=A0ABQ9I588_9NEOP|nr:hypothetical protein PR048_004354 [Dryococelus australis]